MLGAAGGAVPVSGSWSSSLSWCSPRVVKHDVQQYARPSRLVPVVRCRRQIMSVCWHRLPWPSIVAQRTRGPMYQSTSIWLGSWGSVPMRTWRVRVLRLCIRSARAASPWSSCPGACIWVAYRGPRWRERRGTATWYSEVASGGGAGSGCVVGGVGVGVGAESGRLGAPGVRVGSGCGAATARAVPVASRMAASAATGRGHARWRRAAIGVGGSGSGAEGSPVWRWLARMRARRATAAITATSSRRAVAGHWSPTRRAAWCAGPGWRLRARARWPRQWREGRWSGRCMAHTG